MPFVSVKLRSETSSEVRGKPTHRLVFLARGGNDTSLRTGDALNASDGSTSIPASMSDHESGDGTICLRKEAQKIDRSIADFEVTCEYEIDEKTSGGGGGGSDLINPLLRPPEYSFDAAESTETYMIDESPAEDGGEAGKAVLNTAYEPFDQIPVRDASETVITIRRNEASHDPTLETHSRVVVNSENVVIDGKAYPAGTLKLAPPSATKMTEVVSGSPITYYQKTYKIKFRPQGWDEKIENRGYNHLVENKLRPIRNEDREPVTSPWPLFNSGHKMPNPGDTPPILTFVPYKKVSFASLAF